MLSPCCLSWQALSAGILRDNWLSKHRLHRPAVACVFFERDSVLSEAGLAAVCNHLDIARASVRRRGAALVVVLVGREPGALEPLPEDKLALLYRRGGLDARSLLSLVTVGDTIQAPSLHRLCVALQEASLAYYKAEGVRAAAKANLRIATEAAVRTAFKAAVFAEFRQDWTSALQLYKLAYQLLLDAPGAGPGDSRRWQRWYERLLVAEQCHYKCVTLLLHSGAIADAILQLHRHTTHHRRALSGIPAALQVVLWGFLERQFSTCAELLMSPPLNQIERPAALFAAAGNAGVRRRHAWAAFTEAHDGPLPERPTVSVGPYVGQYRREGGINGLTDEDFVAWLTHNERPGEYTNRNLAMLTRAHALFKQHPANTRTLVALLSQMANEYMFSGDTESARRMLESASVVTRCLDGWTGLQVAVLSQMRECARRLSMMKEHREWSVALGCVSSETGTLHNDESAAILSAALATRGGNSGDEERLQLPEACVSCIAGFSAATTKPGDTIRFAAALRWMAQMPGPITNVAVKLVGGTTLPLFPMRARERAAAGWQLFQLDAVVPECGVLTAATLVVELEANLVVCCSLTASNEAEVYAPAHPSAAGAMLVMRAGGSPGLTKTAPAVVPPSAALHIKVHTQKAFVGQLLPVDVTVSATDEVLREATLRVQHADIAAEVLVREESNKLTPCSHMSLSDVKPGVDATRMFLLRWTEPCAAQMLTVQLSCHTTAHGAAASLDGIAQLPAVCEPFSLSANFSGLFGHHSLLPEAVNDAGALVLPRHEALLLSVHAKAGGDIDVQSFELSAAHGWIAQSLAPLAEKTALRTGDVLTLVFQVTATAVRVLWFWRAMPHTTIPIDAFSVPAGCAIEPDTWKHRHHVEPHGKHALWRQRHNKHHGIAPSGR